MSVIHCYVAVSEQWDVVQEAEDVITDLQKELFKAQGIDGVWGIECLGQVGDTYQDDTDFMKLFVTAVERWLRYAPLATILHACITVLGTNGTAKCTASINAMYSKCAFPTAVCCQQHLLMLAGKKKQSMRQSCPQRISKTRSSA